MSINSIHFDAANKGHDKLMKLVNKFASLRPAISPTSLIEEILLEMLPQKITEAETKSQVKT